MYKTLYLPTLSRIDEQTHETSSVRKIEPIEQILELFEQFFTEKMKQLNKYKIPALYILLSPDMYPQVCCCIEKFIYAHPKTYKGVTIVVHSGWDGYKVKLVCSPEHEFVYADKLKQLKRSKEFFIQEE